MQRKSNKQWYWIALAPALVLFAAGWGSGLQAQTATRAPITGEIEQITLTTPTDIYSAGTMVVGGQVVILPKNLLIDLPANRLTLQQIFEQAPAACVEASQSGLAKGDSCNTSGVGAFATISANRTSAGNVIAGDVFIEKGREAVAGTITFINYNDGYFRVNGTVGNDATGVMVRLNDPGSRHTVQQGLGCAPGALNCSPDPRFTLDPDNYTNAFSTGYPYCIPSATSRPFPGLPGVPAGTAQAAPDGTGDLLCPITNRTANPADDSRRFAPIQLGDSILAEGNFETINGVRFLSAHTSRVSVAVATKPDPDQPDYLFMEEVFLDTMGFNNQRARALFIGFATLNTDMRIWSIHRDPVNNIIREFPLASVVGCDDPAVGGPGTCGQNGLVPGAGGNIFKIRYDVDFADPTLIGKKPDLYPCANIRHDPEWSALGICGGTDGTVGQNFAIMSPTPHEIIVRSRKKTSAAPGALITLDINGNQATNGEYLFPLGINLGGLETPEFVEINLGALATPWLFTGVPWNLDRRLGPGGCQNTGGCEGGSPGTPGALTFALDPFPFEGLDPRTNESTIPGGSYTDPIFISGTLTSVRDRILSFFNESVGNFTSTILPWPPANPTAIAVAAPPQTIACAAGGGGGVNQPVTTNPDAASTAQSVAVFIDVLANDTGSKNPATLAASATTPPGNGIAEPLAGAIKFTPSPGFFGTTTFTYTVADLVGNVSNAATVTVTVVQTQPAGNTAPVANSDSASTLDTTPVTINILANDTDNGTAVVPANVTLQLLSQPANGSAIPNGDKTVTYTPVAPFGGTVSFGYRINDGLVDSNVATVSVAVTQVNTPPGIPDIVAIADQSADVGQPFIKLVAATDTPDDSLTFSLLAAPAGMTIGAKTGLITWTPTTAQVGQHGVTVKVTDKGGLFATSSFAVFVGQDTVRVTLAQYTVRSGKLRISGLSTAPGAIITLYNSPNFTGRPLGTARANRLGLWNLGLTTSNRPNERLSARSNAGGSVGNIHLRALP